MKTLKNKLVALLIIALCALAVLVDGDMTVPGIMIPMAVILFFIKEPII